MSFRVVSTIVLAVILSCSSVAVAQSPAAPQVSWELGNLRGLSLTKGDAVDFLLKYTVVVPEGTAANHTVNIDVCQWVPVKNNIPTETAGCSPSGDILVSDLTEVEPGRVYEGFIRYGYDPSQLEFGKVNRYTYTISLRRTDSQDPEQVIAKQELNDVIFAKKKR